LDYSFGFLLDRRKVIPKLPKKRRTKPANKSQNPGKSRIFNCPNKPAIANAPDRIKVIIVGVLIFI
jgi:hypothetical protein